MDAHRDRHLLRGIADRAGKGPAAGPARRAGGGGGLPEDDRGGAAARRPAGDRRPEGARRDPGAAALAGRQPLHLPRVPRVRPGGRGAGDGAGAGTRHRPRHPAARQEGVVLVRGAPARGAGPGQGPAAAHPHQGQLALHRAPAQLPRLHRDQAGQRHRRGGRRIPLPRPVHPRGLPREHRPDSGAAPQAGRGPAAQRRDAGQPRRQGPDRDPGGLPAGGTVPDLGGRADPDRARRAAPAVPPAAPAVPAQGRLRPVHVLRGVPAAGPLHHGGPAAHAGDPARGAERGNGRVPRHGGGVPAGPAAGGGAGQAGNRAGRRGHRRSGSQDRRRGTVVG